LEIGKKEFFNIFKVNFDYEIVDTLIGKAIKMSSYDAFIYAYITGSGYLDNPFFQFKPKGLMDIFYNSLHYDFVTGLFDHTTINNTPYILSQSKPNLFIEDKYIVPVEFENESKLHEELEKYINIFEEAGLNHENIIIQRIELRKKGNGMEPFMEYLSSEYFKRHNYIVETQIPLSHRDGSPDFGGYLVSALDKKNILRSYFNGGFSIIELSMIRNFPNSKFSLFNNYDNSDDNELIVGEAKTSTFYMASQLEKYINTGFFNSAYEIHPNKVKPSKDFFGLLSINKNYKIFVNEPIDTYKLFSTH